MSLQAVNDLKFFHHYQPIYDIQKWRVVGFEGLFRTENLINPEITFELARKNKRLYELDSRSVHKALLTYINADQLLRHEMLFLNVFPSTLINPLFHTLLNKIINENGISRQQIIFEINENDMVNFKKLKTAVDNLKKLGFRIAIDDFGKGLSSIRSVIELKPDFVKLDKYYVEGILLSEQKKDVIDYLLHFCQKFNSELIVEGVEESSCLAFLKSLGVQYAQGYLLGKPDLLKRNK